MQDEVQDELRRIGQLLDAARYPVVRNGGLVAPGGPIISPSTLGKESNHARTRQKASGASPASPAARTRAPSWNGTLPRPSRAPVGPGTSHPAASLVRAELHRKFASELEAVAQAYPGTRTWLDDDGMWVVAESSLLPGLSHKALFIIGIRFASGVVRGWGFWGTDAIGYEWIGPRHTNFPDGSICAFEPTDGTWTVWSPLVLLLDLYSLWAVRHLHLSTFGRWPGRQSVRYPYERMLELTDDEYCGCEESSRLYGQCCKESDQARTQMEEAIRFTLDMHGGIRRPPASICDFVRDRHRVPRPEEVFAWITPTML
ncbi:hypothetical protein [Trinickia mobilis]|uniref:hypothetical protein n=1 Tax=Trinickia mobilis TaxID=2816356 RepID=UPI001A90BDE0|nr:hypothetical protein [Trinickia mobilis]